MSNSSSSQNSRVFAPYVVLAQDTSRLFITIKTGEGYSIASGITGGDVIRFNPQYAAAGITGQYVKSQANTDENAEVVGVVETKSNNIYTVVTHGSILYPPSRLTGICGAGGGLDILFLDYNVAGGLTGTIDITTTGEKIIKPVFQIAPHGTYNGLVVNYIGYKTGNAATVSSNPAGAGNIQFVNDGVTPASNWLNVSEDQSVQVALFSDLYGVYGNTNGPFIERITVTSTPSTALIGRTIYQLSGGSQINTGTIVGVDTSNKYIDAQKVSNASLMTVPGTVYVATSGSGQLFSATASEVYEFTVPAVVSSNVITQNSSPLIPYVETTNTATVTVPGALSVTSMSISGILELGSITDVETRINTMQSQIDTINARLNL